LEHIVDISCCIVFPGCHMLIGVFMIMWTYCSDDTGLALLQLSICRPVVNMLVVVQA